MFSALQLPQFWATLALPLASKLGFISKAKRNWVFWFLICLVSIGCETPVASIERELESPVPVLPAHEAHTADSVLLDWNDIPDAKKYEVQVSRTPDFTDIIHESRVLDRSEEIVGRLERGVKLYWRIRAHGRDGIVGAWSSLSSFTPVRQAFFPSAPTQVAPSNGKKGLERSVVLRWEHVPEAISYHLVVTIDEDMLLYQVDLQDIKDNSYFVENLVLTYPYWWKIRSLNAAGYSDWSPVWIFEVKFHED